VSTWLGQCDHVAAKAAAWRVICELVRNHESVHGFAHFRRAINLFRVVAATTLRAGANAQLCEICKLLNAPTCMTRAELDAFAKQHFVATLEICFGRFHDLVPFVSVRIDPMK